MAIRVRPSLAFLAAVAGAHASSLSACGGSTGPTSSTLGGVVQQASFPAPVRDMTVRSDAGKTQHVTISGDGRFSVSLEQGGTYHFFLGTDGKSTPLVVRTIGARLETGVHVQSGGASVDLGRVRFADPAVFPASRIVPPTSPSECSGGEDASGMPCTGGAAPESCDSGQHGDHQGDHQDGNDGNDSGGDCVDGLDAQTGAPCDGGPAANPTNGTDGETNDDSDADPAETLAMSQFNAPNDIGCSQDGSDGEEGDD